MLYTSVYPSPLGNLTLAADGDALTGVWFEGQKYFASTLHGIHAEADLPLFRQCREWLDRYFAGHNPGATPPVRLHGTPFRMAVWEILKRIPYGETVTYGDIARQMARLAGKPHMSAQAVGSAVGHNPVSIFVPCHRVVGTNGSLTGYAGGLDIKERLLRLEGVDMTRLHRPEQP